MAPPLLSKHGHALICIAEQPGIRLRELADCLGLTERATQPLVAQLAEVGMVSRHRVGRRYIYEIHPGFRPDHGLEQGVTLGELLAPVLQGRRS